MANKEKHLTRQFDSCRHQMTYTIPKKGLNVLELLSSRFSNRLKCGEIHIVKIMYQPGKKPFALAILCIIELLILFPFVFFSVRFVQQLSTRYNLVLFVV